MVEEPIQRGSKGIGGHCVVATTRNFSAVAQFELLFNKIASKINLLNFVISKLSMNHT